MGDFPVTVGLNYGDEKVTSTANINGRTFGTKGIDPLGNVYRWVRNGSTTISGGLLTQGSTDSLVSDAGQTLVNVTVTGVTTISLLSSDTSGDIAADHFAGGTLVIDTSPGQARYTIADSPGAHVAPTTSTTEAIQFKLKEVIRESLTSGTSLGFLRSSKYRDVIVAPGTVTSAFVGFTTGTLPANAHGWVQTAGEGMIKNINSTMDINEQFVFAGTSPGEIEQQDFTSNSTIASKQIVAWSIDANHTANLYGLMKITLE